MEDMIYPTVFQFTSIGVGQSEQQEENICDESPSRKTVKVRSYFFLN